jgi:hypothetical protein
MASGNSLVAFSATDNHPPATNAAVPDVRNGIPVLNFDAATAQAARFDSVLPRHYAGGGLTATLAWMAATATTGNTMWTLAIMRLAAAGDDLDADSFATAQAAAAAAADATSGKLTYTTITLSAGANIDSLAVGEAFRVEVKRDAANGSDTMAGFAQLVSAEIRET